MAFPCGPMVKNSLCHARDMFFIPGQGMKIPHAAGQLSQGATTTVPACLEPGSAAREAIVMGSLCNATRVALLAAPRESPHAARKAQWSQNKMHE